MDALGPARLTPAESGRQGRKAFAQGQKVLYQLPFRYGSGVRSQPLQEIAPTKKLCRQGARDKNVLPKERIMTAQIRSIDPMASPPDREATALVLFRSAARHTH